MPIGILYKYSIPIGISFVTFQGVGYVVDVFKNKCKAEKNVLDYFMYLSLFTSVTSGPINRSESILKQIKSYNNSKFDYKRCVQGFQYVLLGILLKLLISGRMSQVVAAPFTSPETVGGFGLLIASICFTIQIFCDFCGYSYMAYGLSKIIGIDVIQNFEKPYHSFTITEFWRRWHISLSSWLRDYIYIPLGGSRCSKLRTYFNILVIFTVSGLWHGAAWNYIFWGFINGVFLVVEKIIGVTKASENKIIRLGQRVITLILLNTMWIFFRADNLKNAFLIIYKIITGSVKELLGLHSFSAIMNFWGMLNILPSEVIAIVISGVIYLYFEIRISKNNEPIQFFDDKRMCMRWIKYLLIMFTILIIGVTGKASEFIYAKF